MQYLESGIQGVKSRNLESKTLLDSLTWADNVTNLFLFFIYIPVNFIIVTDFLSVLQIKVKKKSYMVS